MSFKNLKSKLVQPQDNPTDPIYCIIVDKYLQPKKTSNFEEKTKELLRYDDEKLHPNAMLLKQRSGERLRPLKRAQSSNRRVVQVRPVNSVNSNATETQHKSRVIIKLSSFTSSLRKMMDAFGERKVEDTRIGSIKTSFEVYCELASLHGFKNLVGATIGQRIFWYFILCLMLWMSVMLLLRTINLHADDPTILYVETTTGTIWGSSFPSVSLCNLNRISKKKIEEFVMKDNSQSAKQINSYLGTVLYNTLPVRDSPSDFRLLQTYLDNKNYTHAEFLRKISPDCSSQLLRCKLHGQIRSCSELFRRVETLHGSCCLFNYRESVDEDLVQEKEFKKHSNRFGYKWGLTVLIDPQVEDYYASIHKLAGYQIFVHSPYNPPAINVPYQLAFPRKEVHVHVVPKYTIASPYVAGYSVENRRCYMSDEYKLITFANYTQTNCFSECRSLKMLKVCGCVPPLWPRAENWTVCTLAQAGCVISNYEVFTKTTLPGNKDYKINPKAEQYICNCYPNCAFTLYKLNHDITPLDRNYSMNDMEFYRGIELKNHLVAHIFYADMSDDIMRLDVRNNWLTYFGMFGGITSLHLGYSFISGFEIIFFLLVRPISNWLIRRDNTTADKTKN